MNGSIGHQARGGALLGICVAVALSACTATGPSSLPADDVQTDWTDDAFALSRDADRAYRESRWIESARLYQRLTERVPSDAYAWFRLGNTFAQQGAFDRAILAYEASLDRNAAQPRPWFNLSTAYLLSAQAAMTRSWEAMRPGDPARPMIERRLKALGELMHQRIEDDV